MGQSGWGLAALAALLACGEASAGPPEAKGALVFAGGALRFSNAAVWGRFVELAGGKGATVVVVPAASGNPARAGQSVVENLVRYGARAELCPIGLPAKGGPLAAARDPAVAARLRKAGGIWFIGGEQCRITAALLGRGTRTPALEAIWEAYRGGAVVGGSSAGAAVMSRVMFADALESLDTLKFGIVKGKHVAPGLGFVGEDWFVDQHFLARGRFARALLAMREYGLKHGIGVDEDTAVVFKGGQFEVVGYNGALVLDLSGATAGPPGKEFRLRGARLTYLDSGDVMDARTRVVKVSKWKAAGEKLDPSAAGFAPSLRKPAAFYFPDMLASGAIYAAMRNAVDSKPGVVKGLAFAQPAGGKKNDLGFEFRVYRAADSVGWYTGAGGHEAYTLVNVRVDITPVKLATPLYTPLVP